MSSIDIYNTLKSKKHNPLYVERYYKFIMACIAYNESTCYAKDYYENHHILPKAKSMWPEYISFRKYPENKARLNTRQHAIAHWLLAKAYGRGMWFSMNMMNAKNRYQHGRGYVSSRLYELSRKHISEMSKKVATGRPKTKESIDKWRKSREGYKHSNKTKKKMSHTQQTKNLYTTSIPLYNGIHKILVLKHHNDLYQYIADGWQTKSPSEYRSNLTTNSNKKRKRTRQVKVYKGAYYCWCVIESDDYYNILENGGSLNMTKEASLHNGKLISIANKGKGKPGAGSKGKIRAYNTDGSFIMIDNKDSLPKGMTLSSPKSKNIDLYIDEENKMIYRVSDYTAEINNFVHFKVIKTSKVKCLDGNGVSCHISLENWPYDWYPEFM